MLIIAHHGASCPDLQASALTSQLHTPPRERTGFQKDLPLGALYFEEN